MKPIYRAATLAATGILIGAVALSVPAGAKGSPPKGQKTAFFTGGTGSAGWVNGNDLLVSSDTDGKVMDLSSPDGVSYGGFVGHAIDGQSISSIHALSYDFVVTTSDWSGGGLGSPRLVVDFSDGGNVALNPVNDLTPGTWVHMDAITGAVDNSGGTCGYLYQASWSTAEACHAGTIVVDAYVVNDSGWSAPLSVEVDNLTLNSTVYSAPTSSKK